MSHMEANSQRRVARRLALPLATSMMAIAGASAVCAQSADVKPDYDFYKGKTVDLMVANPAGTTMGNTFASLQDAFEQALGATVRTNYNSSPAVTAMNDPCRSGNRGKTEVNVSIWLSPGKATAQDPARAVLGPLDVCVCGALRIVAAPQVVRFRQRAQQRRPWTERAPRCSRHVHRGQALCVFASAA